MLNSKKNHTVVCVYIWRHFPTWHAATHGHDAWQKNTKKHIVTNTKSLFPPLLAMEADAAKCVHVSSAPPPPPPPPPPCPEFHLLLDTTPAVRSAFEAAVKKMEAGAAGASAAGT
jgi:hypothetical protein